MSHSQPKNKKSKHSIQSYNNDNNLAAINNETVKDHSITVDRKSIATFELLSYRNWKLIQDEIKPLQIISINPLLEWNNENSIINSKSTVKINDCVFNSNHTTVPNLWIIICKDDFIFNIVLFGIYWRLQAKI